LAVSDNVMIYCIMMLTLVAAVWLDTRTAVTVGEILARTPGHNQDHLRVTTVVSFLLMVRYFVDCFQNFAVVAC